MASLTLEALVICVREHMFRELEFCSECFVADSAYVSLIVAVGRGDMVGEMCGSCVRSVAFVTLVWTLSCNKIINYNKT